MNCQKVTKRTDVSVVVFLFSFFIHLGVFFYFYNEIQADPCDTACDLSTRHLLFPRDFAAPAGFKGCSVVKR